MCGSCPVPGCLDSVFPVEQGCVALSRAEKSGGGQDPASAPLQRKDPHGDGFYGRTHDIQFSGPFLDFLKLIYSFHFMDQVHFKQIKTASNVGISVVHILGKNPRKWSFVWDSRLGFFSLAQVQDVFLPPLQLQRSSASVQWISCAQVQLQHV